MSQDELVPLKKVLGALGVSRATLWRVSRTVPSFPSPTVVRSRVYWRASDLSVLKDAIASYSGRGAFERERRFARLRDERDALRKRQRTRRGRVQLECPDLFDWPIGCAEQSSAPEGFELAARSKTRSG